MLRVEVYARALPASQNAKRSEWGLLNFWRRRRRRRRRIGAQLGCCGLWPSFAYEDARTKEAAERRRADSVDHDRLEVEEHRAWYARAARSLVVEHVDGVEMRVVVAKVLTVAANAVLVEQYLLELGAHLTTALARLQVQNLARRSSLEVESTREKKGAESGKI
jgi:hypothetical protein